MDLLQFIFLAKITHKYIYIYTLANRSFSYIKWDFPRCSPDRLFLTLCTLELTNSVRHLLKRLCYLFRTVHLLLAIENWMSLRALSLSLHKTRKHRYNNIDVTSLIRRFLSMEDSRGGNTVKSRIMNKTGHMSKQCTVET